MKLAFAHTENGARYDLGCVQTQARKAGEGWTLEGEKAGVVGAPMADRIVVVSARAPTAIALFLAEDRRPAKPYRTVDEHARGRSRVQRREGRAARGRACALIEELIDFAHRAGLRRGGRRDEVRLRHDARVPEDAQAVRRADRHLPGAAAPHGRHVHRATSRRARWPASPARKVDRPTDANDRARAVSAAKIKIADSARHVSQESVQLHGGMGMSEELKVSHTSGA